MRQLSTILLAFALAASSLGCVATVHGEAGVVVEDPPPPREEPIEVRAGFVFVQGHWYRAGGRWEWQAGHYERERANMHWTAGRWERRGNGHVWVEGRWENGGTGRAEGGVEVRDHR
jgi:hypothetical protein